MDWTKRQREVIDHNSGDLLVAAAAGSGKTAVLVEKIKRLIIDEGVDVSKFLVVTFTRAAASEMKEKIIEAITKAAAESPEKRDYLSKQLDKLPSASISTFDSFAAEIVREYFYVIDIDPNLSIAGAEDTAIMKKEAVDEVFSEIYEEKDPGLLSFLDSYSSHKSDRMMKDNIISIYEEMMSMPEGIHWIRKAMDSLSIDKEDFDTGNLGKFINDYTKLAVGEAKIYFDEVLSILDDHGLENLYEKLKYDSDICQGIMEAEPPAVREILSSLSFPKLVAAGEEKEPFNEIKDEVKDLRDQGKGILTDLKSQFYGEALEVQLADIKATIPEMESLYAILAKFEECYSLEKSKRGLMDFSDLSHFAIKILDDETVAAEVREKYRYIFIDEYQDSNYLQERIVGAIKRDDNVFMVGDIKQSIYGFRMAEPDIFKERYANYALEESEGSKIDLNNNFRSKKSVIDSVNDIFKYLMDDYNDDAKLHRGDSYNGSIDHKSELHVIDAEDDENLDEEFRMMRNVELEACLAANIVSGTLGKIIYDSKKQVERPLKKGDIVILLRSAAGRAEKYYNALMNCGIEAYIDDNSGYFNTIEISTFMDLIKLVDNRMQDIPLLSVLRSGIFDFSIEELISIRLSDRDAEFNRAFFSYDNAGPLGRKVKEVTEFLDKWNFRRTYMPLDELCWNMMMETGYFDYVGALPAGGRRQGNLLEFTGKARNFGENGDGSLSGFINFMEASSARVDVGQVGTVGEGEDVVRIMTIHKSKGLEFPMVIVSGLGEAMKGAKTRKEGVWHKDIGFALQRVDRDKKTRKKTILERAALCKREMDAFDEEIRILYVALTRAKDYLVMIGSEGSRSTVSFLNKMLPVMDDGITQIYGHSRKDIAAMGTVRRDIIDVSERLADYEKNSKGKGRFDPVLSFKYPRESDLEYKSKYSVTELNKGDDVSYVFNVPQFAGKERAITGAALGTVMHKVMETIDFKTMGSKDKGGRETLAREVALRLVTDNLLTEEEAAAVDISKITGFFDTEIGRRASSADELYKERHFNVVHLLDEKEVILQGIIDCYFVDPDDGKLVLLDYKSNRQVKGIDEIYRKQMLLYKEALEKATGNEVKEMYLYLFNEGEALSIEG